MLSEASGLWWNVLQMLCIGDDSTAVSGSYVTAECEAYPVEGEGPFLVAVVVLFSVLAWWKWQVSLQNARSLG
jgi:hypothetical protein